MRLLSNCWLGLQFEGFTGLGRATSTHVGVGRRIQFPNKWALPPWAAHTQQLTSPRESDLIDRQIKRRGKERGKRGRERVERNATKMEATVFHNIVLEITPHPFCCILLGRPNIVQCGRGLTQGCEYEEVWRSLWAVSWRLDSTVFY